MHDRFIKLVATGFGVGRLPVAPGTAGSLFGIVYALGLMRLCPSWPAYAVCVVVMVLLAVHVTGRAARIMGDPDPASVVLDEIVALPIAMAGLAPGLWTALVAFAWFRLFDIWKPPPVHQLQRLPGGWGIVMDDVAAGVYAAVASHATLEVVSWFQ